MDEHGLDQDTTREILGTLRDARPPREVEERIVARSLERLERSRSDWWRPLGLTLAGATAAVAIGVGLHLFAPALDEGKDGFSLPSSGSLHAAGELPNSFRVGSHEILLSPSSKVKVQAAEPLLTDLRVESGKVTFDVDPLGPGEIFRVRTDQVLVEVVGTRFSVQAHTGCSVVVVEEGRVRVTDTHGVVEVLDPGGRGRYCPGIASDVLLREALILISTGESLGDAVPLLETYLSKNQGSPLEEEALFHLCLVQARLGLWDEARRLAAEFRERFPESVRIARLDEWLTGDQ